MDNPKMCLQIWLKHPRKWLARCHLRNFRKCLTWHLHFKGTIHFLEEVPLILLSTQDLFLPTWHPICLKLQVIWWVKCHQMSLRRCLKWHPYWKGKNLFHHQQLWTRMKEMFHSQTSHPQAPLVLLENQVLLTMRFQILEMLQSQTSHPQVLIYKNRWETRWKIQLCGRYVHKAHEIISILPLHACLE